MKLFLGMYDNENDQQRFIIIILMLADANVTHFFLGSSFTTTEKPIFFDKKYLRKDLVMLF